MRFRYIGSHDGKTRVNWLAVLAFMTGAYAGIIGAAEVFWYLFTGGFSALIGGYALVVATLTVIRVVGASLADPYSGENARLHST